jgi:hypothetical protein
MNSKAEQTASERQVEKTSSERQVEQKASERQAQQTASERQVDSRAESEKKVGNSTLNKIFYSYFDSFAIQLYLLHIYKKQ